MASQLFRASVVIIVRRDDGHILVFERSDVPGSWQLPQGGIDIGEEPLDAAVRELYEETGISSEQVILVSELAEWITYEWPRDIRRGLKDGHIRRGQVQKWFLFGVPADVSLLPQPDGEEFNDWQWMEPHHLIQQTVDFRRDSYSRAFARLLP